ncbi:hypothetical protein AGDE_12778 [Angomonas deanei]|nr:hypothetical protein AGDE_12778 [Angomonas deanei]|eukprot:EPY23521.1 hypothetical protein AGDE_12778 [Angomonas deanei]
MNLSSRYSVDLFLSKLGFADLPNALLVPGAEFVVPPIEVSIVPEHLYKSSVVPWSIRELPHCGGTLHLDFSLIGNEGVCTEPLDECTVEIDAGHQSWKSGARFSKDLKKSAHLDPYVEREYDGRQFSRTESEMSRVNDGGFRVSALQPVMLSVKVVALWQRSVPLNIRFDFDKHCDVGSLIGAVNTTCPVGEMGKMAFTQKLELIVFKHGLHHITVTISDPKNREITYLVPVYVEEERP